MDDPSRTVLVDMDGVLADFDRRVVEELQETHPQLRHAASRTQAQLLRAFPECEREIRGVILQPTFFQTLPLIDDAIEGWRRIEAAGFTPRVCSSPFRDRPLTEVGKRAWLQGYLGGEVARDAIIDLDKATHRGIALIDDRCDIEGIDRAPWQLILFDASYNRQYDAPRLFGWRDPQLPVLLQKAQEQYRARQQP